MRWVWIASITLACGGTEPAAARDDAAPPAVAEPDTPLAPLPEFTPELGTHYDLAYRGSVALDPNGADGAELATTATITITPRDAPLTAIAFHPGLYDAAVRPVNSYFDWDWPLQSLSSDRAMHVEVDDWKLTLTPESPVPPGDTWTVEFENLRGVAVLEAIDFASAIGEPTQWQRMSGGAEILELANLAMERFARTAYTTSFAQDEFYVLMPPWPVPFDCGGKPVDAAFAPTECVARGRIPARVDVRMPDGWDTVVPVDSSLPFLIVTSPTMARSSTSVGDRTVALCGPSGRADALEELAARVRADLPALEQRLGPYPYEQLTVCLSPMPLTHAGLAHGRLALVADAMFGSVLPDGDTSDNAVLRRLDDWVRTGAMFRAFREEIVLHELAHHWWGTELPDRWGILLDEGAATYIADAVLRERYAGTEVGYFAEASPWIAAARVESVGVALPPLSTYLNHRGARWSVAEDQLPYVHGFRLYQQLLAGRSPDETWASMRAMMRGGPPAAVHPERVMIDVPSARRRLQRVLADDQSVVAGKRVDLVTYSFRESIGILDKELRAAGMSPLALLAMLHQPDARRRNADMMARFFGATGAEWYVTGAVMTLLESQDCVERPEDAGERARCQSVLETDGAVMLGAVMAMAGTDEWLVVDADDDAWDDLMTVRDPALLAAMARRLADAPVRVSADDARRLAGADSPTEAVAGLLFARMHARWAARVYLELLAPGG